jgi:hypothetical protein
MSAGGHATKRQREDRARFERQREDWPSRDALRLSCPRCGNAIEVRRGAEAWCTRHPARVEMEASAT